MIFTPERETHMNNTTKRIPLLLLLAAAAASPLPAAVRGALNVGQQSYQGMISWINADKAYQVVGANNASMSFQLARVTGMNIPRPAQTLDGARRTLAAGNYQAVVNGLLPVFKEYFMLGHDEEIAGLLAQAYTALKNPKEAIKICESITALKPEAAYRGRMTSGYWAALLADNKTAALEKLLDSAIRSGMVEAMAQALVLRGDLLLKRAATPTQNDYRAALVDGYLRVVVLYSHTARDILPEALYKAAVCFEKMGQMPRAQTFREQLRREFPSSEWASK